MKKTIVLILTVVLTTGIFSSCSKKKSSPASPAAMLPDGSAWNETINLAGFSPRNSFGSLVFNNEMWVIGGWNGSALLNDVWNSSNGTSWTQVTGAAGFSARVGFGNVVYNN